MGHAHQSDPSQMPVFAPPGLKMDNFCTRTFFLPKKNKCPNPYSPRTGEWLRCRISAPGDSPTGPSRTPAGKERTAEDGVHHKTRSRMLYSSFMEKNFYRWGVKNTPSKIFLARIKKKKQRFFFFLRLKNFSFSNISLGAPLLRNTLAKCLRSFYVFKILARLASQVIQKFIQ